MIFNKKTILFLSLFLFSGQARPEDLIKICDREKVANRDFLVLKKIKSVAPSLDNPYFIMERNVKNLSTTYYSFKFVDAENKKFFLSVDPTLGTETLKSLIFKQIGDLTTTLPDESLWILNGNFNKCAFQNVRYNGFLSFKTGQERPKIDALGFNPRAGVPREFNFVYKEDKYSTYMGAKQHEKFDRIGRLLVGNNAVTKFDENSQEGKQVLIDEMIDITGSILTNMYSIDSITRRWLVTAGGVETDYMLRDSDKSTLKVRDIDVNGQYQISDFLSLIGANSAYVEKFNYLIEQTPNAELIQKAKTNISDLTVFANSALGRIEATNRPICYGDKIKLLNTASWKHLFCRAGSHSKFPALNSESGIVVFSSDYNPVYDRFGLDEAESWWIIRAPDDAARNIKVGDSVKFGDGIRLENVFNGKFLLSTTKTAKFNLNTNDATNWEGIDLVFVGKKTQENLFALSDVWTITSGADAATGSPVSAGNLFSLSSGTKKLAFSDLRKFYFSSGGETYDNLINFAFLIPDSAIESHSSEVVGNLWTIESHEKVINYPFGSAGWLDTSISSLDPSGVGSYSLKIVGSKNETITLSTISENAESKVSLIPLFDFKLDEELANSNTVESKNLSDLEVDIKRSFIIRSRLSSGVVGDSAKAQAKGMLGTILSYVTGGLSDSIYSGLFSESESRQSSKTVENVGDFSNSPGIIQFSPCDTKNIYEEFLYDSWDPKETVRFSKQTTPGFFIVADWPKILGDKFLTLSRNKPIIDNGSVTDDEFEKIEKLSNDMYKAKGFRVNRYHADLGSIYTSDALSGQRDDYDADFTIRRYKKVDGLEVPIVCPDEFRDNFINGTLGSGIKHQDSDWAGLSTLEIKTPYSLADMLTIISRCYTYRKLSKDPEIIKKSLEFEKAFASDAQKALARIYTFYFGGFGGRTFDNSSFFEFNTFKMIENKAFTFKENQTFNDQLITELKKPLKYGDMVKILSYKTWRHLYGKADSIRDFDIIGKFNQGFPFLFSDYSFLSDKLGFTELQSWWIIKGPHDKNLFLGKRVRSSSSVGADYHEDIRLTDSVKNNDVIRLENALTGKNLHLTNNEAVFYENLGKSYIVSLYGNSGQGDDNDNFKIKISSNSMEIDESEEAKEFTVLNDKTPRNLTDNDLHIASVFELVGESEIDGKKIELFSDHDCTLSQNSGLFEGLETIVGVPEGAVVDKKCAYWSIDSFKRNWANAAG